MRKLIVGLDYDGVIVDNIAYKCELARDMFGLEVPPACFVSGISEVPGYLDAEQYRQLVGAVYGLRASVVGMRPIPDAMYFIQLLLAEGHAVSVVTARKGDWLKIAQEWLTARNLSLPTIGVGSGVSKADALKGFQVFVDDTIEILEQLQDTVPERYLFTSASNRSVAVEGVATRITTWQQLYFEIQRHAGSQQ